MKSELQETLDELGAEVRGERGRGESNSQAIRALAAQASVQTEESFQAQRSEQAVK